MRIKAETVKRILLLFSKQDAEALWDTPQLLCTAMDGQSLSSMLSTAWVYEWLCVYPRTGNLTKSCLPGLVDGHKDSKQLENQRGISADTFLRCLIKHILCMRMMAGLWVHISYREGRMRDEKWVRERKKEDVGRGGERGRVCTCASTLSVAINTQGPRAKYRLTQLFAPKC